MSEIIFCRGGGARPRVYGARSGRVDIHPGRVDGGASPKGSRRCALPFRAGVSAEAHSTAFRKGRSHHGMGLPQDLSGAELAKALARVGYKVTRQTGSHVRPTTDVPSQHHVTVPAHDPLNVGTLILSDVATHLNISRDESVRRLFG